VIDC